MELIIAATMTGAPALMGMLASNSRSRAVMETKIDELSKRCEMHINMVERTLQLEQDFSDNVVANIDALISAARLDET